MKIKALALLIIAALASGCVSTPEPYNPGIWGTGGAVAGATIGAGTGAIIGAHIPNGVISASALTGAVIGLPVGILLALEYAEYQRGAELRAVKAQVEENGELIEQRNHDLVRLREKLMNESSLLETNEENSEHLYPGTTLGMH